LAGALGLALLGGPAAANETITLRVPVQLKKMLADKVRVECIIFRGGNQSLTGHQAHNVSAWYDIANGEFDQIIEMAMTAGSGNTLVGTDQYRCQLQLPTGNPGGHTLAIQGTPSGNNDPKLPLLAKPDQFFRAQAIGRLDGVGVINPDLGGGPKDFKGKKQP
jgi:hypothetical protein